jgi:hypothetical protein
MRLHNRLSCLEQREPDPGCQGCRERRGRIVMVVADRQADGSVVLRDQEPEECARCGIVPEYVVKVIVVVVGGPDRSDEPLGGSQERT